MRRLAFYRSIFVRPWVGFVYGALGIWATADFVADKVLGEDYLKTWKALSVVPQWQWRTWFIVGLGLAVIVAVEGAYVVVRRLENELLELRAHLDDPAHWERLRERFRQGGDFGIVAMWTRNIATQQVTWNVMGGLDERNREYFNVLAMECGELARHSLGAKKLVPGIEKETDSISAWFTVVAALVSHGEGFTGEGHEDGVSYVSGQVTAIIEASGIACVRLGIEDRSLMRSVLL